MKKSSPRKKEIGKNSRSERLVIVETYWEKIQKKLDSIREKNLYRQTKTYSGIDFCSNDYLSLTTNQNFIEAIQSLKTEFFLGSTASRLVRGNSESMEIFEAEFAEFVQAEAALLVSTGYVANMGLIDSIALPNSYVFTDRLNHASILDGIRISMANKKYYNHLDMDDLEKQLLKASSEDPNQKKLKVVVTETIFSMDGDMVPLKQLLFLKEKYNFVLVLDEAHALGVYGKEGRGLVFRDLTSDEIDSIDYRVYTLGKSFGLEGGVICTKKIGRDHLVNVMRPFIFSTAPLPLISKLALKALSLIRLMEDERTHLEFLAKYLKDKLRLHHFQTTDSSSHIVPILMENEMEALTFASELQNLGLDVRAIRPPTVPTARLRVSLNANRTKEDIDILVEALTKIRNSF
ncbi:8-amino-7-oxononanoate synthase [Leptospira sp. 96542]|nr:8-amino-7-oxononanoate synthase [Leptospira sp. 96542]